MLPSVLIVDDEKEIINALKRALHGKFDIQGFTDPIEAIKYFEAYPSHIVISDMRMPEMTGAELLTKVAQLHEPTKRVVLTGYADLSLAAEAINQGKISCYIAKPWDNKNLIEQLNLLVDDIKKDARTRNTIKRLSIDHKKLNTLEQTLSLLNEKSDQQVSELKEMNVELLHLGANLVSFFCQDGDRQSERVAQQAKLLGKRLGLPPAECQHIYLAGLYHKIGYHVIPEELANKAWYQMTKLQQKQWAAFAVTSGEILSSSRLLESSGKLLHHLFEHVDGQGFPDGLLDEDIPLGSKILSTVLYYDLLVRGDILNSPVNHGEAEIVINKMSGSVFDRRVINALYQLILSPQSAENFERIVLVSELVKGMRLTKDVYDVNQRKLLPAETELSLKQIEQLKAYQDASEQQLIIYVEGQQNVREANEPN